MIEIGCCGFPVNRRLYYQIFTCCEIQITFYTFPKISLLEKWREEAPRDFSFLIKASQLITHPANSPTYKRFNPTSFPLTSYNENKFGFFQRTKEVMTAWEEVRREAEALKAKVILFQTPPSFSEEKSHWKNLYTFFSGIDRSGLLLVWEPRGNWSDATLREISNDLKLILAFDPMVRMPISGLFQQRGRNPCRFYFRLHGGKGYRHKFTNEELKEVAQKASSLKNGYILFNNIAMFEDARRMKELF
jgi:uncharacterized protein YecE (DUF72 family)